MQAQDADLAARLMLVLAALLDPSSGAAAGLTPDTAGRLDQLAVTLAGAHALQNYRRVFKQRFSWQRPQK